MHFYKSLQWPKKLELIYLLLAKKLNFGFCYTWGVYYEDFTTYKNNAVE